MKRSEEITTQYFDFLINHIRQVVSGEVPEFMEVNEIAGELAVSHKHLTDTIKKKTGQHPCYFYDEEIIRQAKQMLVDSDKSVAEIARILTYDPSNFSKFFKKVTGKTPGDFRSSSSR
ncbi:MULTISPECIES: helix-turn-helix domain-containing protein [Chryseobacterium]|uniref:AraC family transcriptional regulator n=1 Tax=Chryseobacterium pennae TaxID=2258962 RepID=A0A3D9CDJ8_9FLAO|nr:MULTISPECIES: AraC family transcriptional regulator [Chryseobacterium]MCS4304014.1 AraC-like DNA-binding protein [Chryseobacterium sp. BIGb0232]REC63915.1 AraC family transcriptional regulator [Chryseobacterium pennae]ROS17597.1 AraC-like DNA-binding protein [Chryseobacterium nakagawai]